MAWSGWTPNFFTIVLIFLSSLTYSNIFTYDVLVNNLHLSPLGALASSSSISDLLLQCLNVLSDLFCCQVHGW